MSQEKINESTEPKNYYDVIVEKIKTMMKKDPKKALFLVEKELDAPYIPKDYEAIFKEMLLEAIQNYENNRKLVKFSPYECLDILKSNNKRLKPIALAELRSYNLKPFLIEIGNLFLQNDLEIQIKASIYEFLCEQDVNYDFLCEGIKINPYENKSLVNNSFYKLNREQIEQKTFKDISIKNIAFEVLNSYCATVFPQAIFLGKEDYSQEFILIAKKLLGITIDDEKTPLYDKIYDTIFIAKI